MVQSRCADQNSNCILGKMLQIIYFIKLGRDEVHTISSMIIIDNFFAKKNCMNIKNKNIRILSMLDHIRKGLIWSKAKLRPLTISYR